MKAVWFLWLASLAAWGCGGESTRSDEPQGEQPDEDDVFCEEGCEATLAAQCPVGPDTQAECEQDCRSFASGPCRTEYVALRECADGKTLTCSSLGLPSVPGCEAEQNAFAMCL